MTDNRLLKAPAIFANSVIVMDMGGDLIRLVFVEGWAEGVNAPTEKEVRAAILLHRSTFMEMEPIFTSVREKIGG